MLSTISDLDTSVNKLHSFSGKLEKVSLKFSLGDLNGDKLKDSAVVSYYEAVLPDSTIQRECGQNVCYVRISFSSNIPEIIIEGYTGYLKKIGDVNGDNNDDMLIFTSNNRPIWGDITIVSLYKNKWRVLETVQAFLGDDGAYENRIVRSKSTYYVLADVWNKNSTEYYRKRIKIRKQ